MKQKFNIISDMAFFYKAGKDKFVKSAAAPMLKNQKIDGEGKEVKLANGKSIFAIEVNDDMYLQPKDVKLMDANGEPMVTFTDKGGERLRKSSVKPADKPKTPIADYLEKQENEEVIAKEQTPEEWEAKFSNQTADFSSTGSELITYEAQRPKRIFELKDNRLFKTDNQIPQGKEFTAKSVKIMLRDKMRHLLEIGKNKYIVHNGVKPILSSFSFDSNDKTAADVGGDTAFSKQAKNADSAVVCENKTSSLATILPIAVGLMAGVIAFKQKHSTLAVVAFTLAGAAAGYTISSLIKVQQIHTQK